MQIQERWQVAGLFLALILTSAAISNATIPGEVTPENQDLPCPELYGCNSWCRQDNCGCVAPAGKVVCGSTCRCTSSGDIRTCTFC